MFIGEKKVKDIKKWVVTFDDWSTVTITPKQEKYLVTKEEKDATALQSLVVNNVVPDVLQVLQEHNVRKGDINAVLQVTVSSYNRAFNEAVGKAFGTYKEWNSPEGFADDITMADIARIKNL